MSLKDYIIAGLLVFLIAISGYSYVTIGALENNVKTVELERDKYKDANEKADRDIAEIKGSYAELAAKERDAQEATRKASAAATSARTEARRIAAELMSQRSTGDFVQDCKAAEKNLERLFQ